MTAKESSVIPEEVSGGCINRPTTPVDLGFPRFLKNCSVVPVNPVSRARCSCPPRSDVPSWIGVRTRDARNLELAGIKDSQLFLWTPKGTKDLN
ncbi:hypothetical protein AVEN_109655-1 [Araneus ventricosus]|uniref:Uncharacterized protein n=1 Tax=Araneus ventricosus TaxID=182803 RepID=A0A4Y2FY60_ARAVE|nr:hypothetical protein AVEN_109655-1 [Araneus ventricosus]